MNIHLFIDFFIKKVCKFFPLFLFFTLAVYIFISHFQEKLSIVSIVLICVPFIILVVVALFYLNFYYISQIHFENEEKFRSNCADCANNQVHADEIVTGNYGLKTLSELLIFENKMQKGDDVIIYTSKIDSENKEVNQVVESNRERGVNYYIVYYPNKENEKKDMEIIERLYDKHIIMEEEIHSFDSHLSKDSAFDLLLYKKSGEITAYFCVNYAANNSACINQVACKNPCAKKSSNNVGNSRLIYKSIDPILANSIYTILSKKIEK